MSKDMIIDEKESSVEYLLHVAQSMMTAARTAPKAKGVDNLEIITATGDTIKELAARMVELAPKLNKMFFVRDAENILQAGAVVIIGTRCSTHGLNCGYCGWATCAEKIVTAPCAFNMHDMGIAVGSAAALAADARVDSRVMYSVGVAAMELGILGENCHAAIAIPISSSGKSPFFDRQSTR